MFIRVFLKKKKCFTEQFLALYFTNEHMLMYFSGTEEQHSAEADVFAINVHENLLILTIIFEENKAMY